jgi:hypothetical protein
MRRKLFFSASLIAAALTAALPTVTAQADSSGKLLDLTSLYQMVVDSAHEHLFFSSNYGADTVLVTDLAGNTVTHLDTAGAAGMALSPDGSTLYVGGAAVTGPATVTDTVTAYSTTTLAQTAQYSLSGLGAPQYLAVQSGKLWVSLASGTTSGTIGDFDLSATAPVFEMQPAVGDWTSAPIIAADPTGTGNMLVAVQPKNETSSQVETFNTSQDPVVFQAAGGVTFGDNNTCGDVSDVVVVPGGGQFIPVCEAAANLPAASAPDALYRYSTANLSEQGSYGPVSSPDAVAIAPDSGLVAGGGSAGSPVFEPGGDAPVNVFSDSPIAGGIGLSADGSELYVVTGSANGLYLNVYDNPSVPRTTTSTPTPTPTTTPTATPTPTTTPTRTPAFTLAATPSTSAYKPTVRVTVHLGSTGTNRSIAIYAQTLGNNAKTRIASGRVNSAGDLTVSYPASHSTTFSAVFTGDAEYVPRTVTTSVTVAAVAKLSVGGYYGTSKKGPVTYLLFRKSAKLKATVTVLPAKSGECVKMQSQYYYKDAWHADVTSGCITLNKSSAATGYLTLSKDHLGYPYRVRIDYIRGKDISNLSANSGWQSFKVLS